MERGVGGEGKKKKTLEEESFLCGESAGITKNVMVIFQAISNIAVLPFQRIELLHFIYNSHITKYHNVFPNITKKWGKSGEKFGYMEKNA